MTKTSRARILALALLLAALAAPLAAKEPFAPRHVAKLRSVSAAVISPDGSRIAYAPTVPRQPLEEKDGPAPGPSCMSSTPPASPAATSPGR